MNVTPKLFSSIFIVRCERGQSIAGLVYGNPTPRQAAFVHCADHCKCEGPIEVEATGQIERFFVERGPGIRLSCPTCKGFSMDLESINAAREFWGFPPLTHDDLAPRGGEA